MNWEAMYKQLKASCEAQNNYVRELERRAERADRRVAELEEGRDTIMGISQDCDDSGGGVQ